MKKMENLNVIYVMYCELVLGRCHSISQRGTAQRLRPTAVRMVARRTSPLCTPTYDKSLVKNYVVFLSALFKKNKILCDHLANMSAACVLPFLPFRPPFCFLRHASLQRVWARGSEAGADPTGNWR